MHGGSKPDTNARAIFPYQSGKKVNAKHPSASLLTFPKVADQEGKTNYHIPPTTLTPPSLYLIGRMRRWTLANGGSIRLSMLGVAIFCVLLHIIGYRHATPSSPTAKHWMVFYQFYWAY